MSDVPPPSSPPPPPPPGGGYTPPPPPPPPPPGGGYNPPPPPGGGYQPPGPPPPGGGFVPPPPMGYTPGGAGYAAPRTDGLAIGSLIVGIVSIVCAFMCLGIVDGPAAAIMGFISRQRVAASGGTLGGGGLALAGLILGIIGFLASAGSALFWIIAISQGSSSSS